MINRSISQFLENELSLPGQSGLLMVSQVREGLWSSELRRHSRIRDAVAWTKSSKIW